MTQNRALVGCAVLVLVAAALRAADDVAVPRAPATPPAVERSDGDVNPLDEAVLTARPRRDEAATAEVVHPQVNLGGFSREYRSLPIDATKADTAIRAALDRPIEVPWEFHETTLRELVEHVRETLGVAVEMDDAALMDSGIDPADAMITARLERMTSRAALRFLLRPLGLTWIAADEMVLVTTVDRAQQRLVTVAYPLPCASGPNGDPDVETATNLIHSTVAPQAWDVVGGPGSIQPMKAGGEPLLVISQTCEVHDDVERLLRTLHERGLAEFKTGDPVLRVHHVADEATRDDLARRLKDLCNERLGAAADAGAEVESLGGSIAVLSPSPAFQVLAAKVIAAVTGVAQPAAPNQAPLGPICWVAREVYGDDDPRWLAFRGWVLWRSPAWFRTAYGRWGPAVAGWLRDRPAARILVRFGMDGAIRSVDTQP